MEFNTPVFLCSKSRAALRGILKPGSLDTRYFLLCFFLFFLRLPLNLTGSRLRLNGFLFRLFFSLPIYVIS